MQRYNQPVQQFIFSVDKDIVFAQQKNAQASIKYNRNKAFDIFYFIFGFY